MSYQALLAIGTNVGDLAANVRQALLKIREQVGPLLRISHFYATEPMGAADQPFLNGAVIVATDRDPDHLLKTLLAIEESMGRRRTVRWGNRLIDLDVLLIRDHTRQSVVHTSATLKVPHPEITNRAFVVVPAAEIADDWAIGATGQTIRDVLLGKSYKLTGTKMAPETLAPDAKHIKN